MSCSSGATVTQLTDPVDHGEGPAWDERTGMLYFVDLFNGKLNAYNVNSGEVNLITMEGNLTLVIPSEFDTSEFVVGLNQAVLKIHWTDENNVEVIRVISSVDEDRPRNRLNDGKADRRGRLWLGTMGFDLAGEIIDVDSGSLYFISNETAANPVAAVHPVNISNGMAWNKANNKFYFIDTTADQVTEYDYDDYSATLSNPKVVFDVNDFTDQITGHPDGMTIDVNDKLWIALYGGGAVIQFDPIQNQILQIISIPATYTTSACWGGDNLDHLYVTTSRYLLDQREREAEPLAGSLFVVTVPVDHAEGPVWDSRTGLLYFVDIHTGIFNSYNIKTNEHKSVQLDGELSVAIPSEADPFYFIVGLNRSAVAIEWDGEQNLKSSTMGYEDLNGNLDADKGSLYFITKENLPDPEAVITPVNISNGLAWNKANDKFYYIDTPTDQVKEYDYDNDSGHISNPRVVFDVNTHSEYITGHPDGMTIDVDDNLWIALYDGGAVVHVNPKTNQLLQIIPIPAQYTTSVCWGGENFDILFVTTSRYALDNENRKRQSAAGSVFAVKGLDTSGLPSFRANIDSAARNHACNTCS
ncbi:regucalcin [Holotrichia oblita]|uniref:Regucalcin n=2 Tax=Holotrichia oblita TaxID=644536 RepID=A0ACB9T3C9_HOLOL|nr:regucalcin [Holotrichia oblita]KAI4461326.1 regucalcin [Holotrichia oblita]